MSLRLTAGEEKKPGERVFVWPLLLLSVLQPTDLGAVPPARKSSQVTNADSPPVTAENSDCRIINWIAVRRTGAVCVATRTGGTTFGTHSSASGSVDLSGTSPWAQNYAVRMRFTATTTGAADHRTATATTSTDSSATETFTLVHRCVSLRNSRVALSSVAMGAPAAIDEDKLDVGQLFLELRSSTQQHKIPIEVRVGRQNLNYGDGSLVSIRDLNVRRPFDGIKLMLRPHDWGIDVFAAKPVETSPGFFDDAPDHTQTFWGIWGTDKKEQSFVRQLDFYYLGLDRKNAQFDQGTARERRNTLGVRAHETASKLAFIQEGDLQSGTFGSGRLLAWKFADGLSYSLSTIRLHPILELQGAISSGDKNPQTVDLQTFYPLFPSGLYYGDMVFTSGSLNAIVAHPSIGMQLSKGLSSNVDSFFLWRQRTTDGLYSQAGMFLAQDSHRGRATWVQRRI